MCVIMLILFFSVSSVDSKPEIINPATSQVNQAIVKETKSPIVNKQSSPAPNQQVPAPEIFNNNELTTFPETPVLTATELLSASIEKLAKEAYIPKITEPKEVSSAIDAQVKLTQSIARAHPEFKMKDINLNVKTSGKVSTFFFTQWFTISVILLTVFPSYSFCLIFNPFRSRHYQW